ncbi:hypothetical protein MNBD_GAMMA03-25 [hydrothermal vent metagenome]|uniref:Uncharacterized protein n=1 Tax=hydrothermal vent metagenome TaxID=652676 RepID=A0A3B0W950_9ZZZZ
MSSLIHSISSKLKDSNTTSKLFDDRVLDSKEFIKSEQNYNDLIMNGDLDTEIKRIKAIQDLEHSNADQKTRKAYAYWVFGLLVMEIIGLFILIIFAGLQYLVLPEWTLNIFSTAVLLQTFATFNIIIKYFFSK